jgi:type II secretory pathway pseudopilin PulG
MSGRADNAAGFSLVEAVIAMLILGLVAIAMIPALYQGAGYTIEQSNVATATRHLNKLIEQARESPSCDSVDQLGHPAFPDEDSLPDTITDARGHQITTTAQSGYACTPGVLNSVQLTARGQGNRVLAEVSAKILMNQ